MATDMYGLQGRSRRMEAPRLAKCIGNRLAHLLQITCKEA